MSHTRIQPALVPSRCHVTSPFRGSWSIPCAILGVWALSGSVLAQRPGVGQSSAYVIPGPVDRYIYPYEDVAAIINNSSQGRTYVLKAGVHRITNTITLAWRGNRTDQLYGENGAIISGAVDLGPWTQGNWFGGETWWGLYIPRPSPNGNIDCDPDFPNANYPDVVFRGGVALTERLGWGAALDANEFCYPGAYYLHETSNPNLGLPHQVATQQFAAVHLAGYGARLGNVIIEGFATPGEMPAVFMYIGTVENCEIRCNHGIGIFMSDVTPDNALTVKNNYIHHNGLSAIYGAGGLIQNNEIAWNNNSRFNPFWGGGGSKFLNDANGITIEANYSYRNHGPGLWSDIENAGHLYRYNVCELNDRMGIFFEIGNGATITQNIARRNGINDPWDFDAVGIVACSSPNVTIDNNILDRNAGGGVSAVRDFRWVLTGFVASNNIVSMVQDTVFASEDGLEGMGACLMGGSGTTPEALWANELAPPGHTPFSGNRYHADLTAPRLMGAGRWLHTADTWYDWNGWQNILQQDPGGSFTHTTDVTEPTMQSVTVSVSGSTYTATVRGVSDASGIRGYRFFLDNVPLAGEQASNSKTIPNVPAGTHTVSVLVCDNAGTTRWSSNAVVQGAIYELEPQNAPGMRLDAAGGGSGPADALLWQDHNGANQQWRFISVGGGVFKLQPQSGTSTVLDVDYGHTASGTNVSTYYDQSAEPEVEADRRRRGLLRAGAPACHRPAADGPGREYSVRSERRDLAVHARRHEPALEADRSLKPRLSARRSHPAPPSGGWRECDGAPARRCRACAARPRRHSRGRVPRG
jgi:hypothetical protein